VPNVSIALPFLLALSLLLPGARGVEAAGQLRTGFTAWRAAEAGFTGWERRGTLIGPNGQLELATAGEAGEATSPAVALPFEAVEAIPSWNADAPAGAAVEVFLRARLGDRWTDWYAMGVWTTDNAPGARHSVAGQRDADAAVLTDTLQLRRGGANALQLRVRLLRDDDARPSLRNAAIAYSTAPLAPDTTSVGDSGLWRGALPVPACSQMVYRDGGNVWCSPTSTSMVLGYWRQDDGLCEPRVRAAVAGVYDAVYRGHGNWSFNAAYAGSQGYEGYVARFESLADLEPWLAAGVPVVFSFSYRAGELANSPLTSVGGHLSVLVGFDSAGNAIVNDPAASGNGLVQRTYRRAQLERLWLERGGGTVYLIYPPGWSVPPL
jgi:hypothetical protein